MRAHLRLPALAAALLLAANPAHADAPLWELGLGLGGLSLPHYRGSDQTHHEVLPVPYAVYRGQIFRATREGARAVLLDSQRVDVDLGCCSCCCWAWCLRWRWRWARRCWCSR